MNGKNDEIAVGANDNCCTIWSIKDFSAPVLKFVLPHNAAIKAYAIVHGLYPYWRQEAEAKTEKSDFGTHPVAPC